MPAANAAYSYEQQVKPSSANAYNRHTFMNTTAVLFICKNGNESGDQRPWSATGTSKAMCNKKITELRDSTVKSGQTFDGNDARDVQGMPDGDLLAGHNSCGVLRSRWRS